jgi:hypothetical protein
MAGFFGNLGDGSTIRAFGLVAAFASVGAIALGVAADHYARTGAPGFLAALIPPPQGSGPAGPRTSVIDYATTGLLQPPERRELVVTGPCGDGMDQR